MARELYSRSFVLQTMMRRCLSVDATIVAFPFLLLHYMSSSRWEFVELPPSSSC
jgi:hypothetical protein